MTSDSEAKFGIVVQARMGSSRLPGKVLMPFLDSTFLAFQLRRILRVTCVSEIIVATTQSTVDDDLCEAVTTLDPKLSIFRGSEHDVLDRMYRASIQKSLTHIIRLNGDCPLIDPLVVDALVEFYLSDHPDADYVSTILGNTFPIGMHVELITFNALEKAHFEAEISSDREHVTPYIYNEPCFVTQSFDYKVDASDLRLTLDYPEDLLFLRRLGDILGDNLMDMSCDQLVMFLRDNPELNVINAKFYKKQSLRR